MTTQQPWEIDAPPLMVRLRPRGVRLAGIPNPPKPDHPVRPANVANPVSRTADSLAPTSVAGHNHTSEESAYARGRMDGERAVNEQLLQQRQEIRELQEHVLDPLRRAISDVVRETEDSLVALAIQVAERLVSNVPISAEMVRAAIHEALQETKEAAECHIYLHPEDLQLVQNWSPVAPEKPNGESVSPPARPTNASALYFHASADVERGGCIVKTRFGTIDGQRRTKAEQLRRTLLP